MDSETITKQTGARKDSDTGCGRFRWLGLAASRSGCGVPKRLLLGWWRFQHNWSDDKLIESRFISKVNAISAWYFDTLPGT